MIAVRNIWLMIGIGLSFWALGTSARASGQQLCNETSFIIYAAIAFPDPTSLVSQGWTRLRPAECRTVLPAPLPTGDYFVFARSSEVHRGGIRQWSGPTSICIDQTDFSVSGLANCENLGLESRNFQIIEGNSPEGRRTVFVEANEYGSRALLAGLQRLLKDNGLSIRKVDGYSGRRTRLALNKYLKSIGMKKRPNDSDLIDALEASARQMRNLTGLEVCNEADGVVWTAYARRRNKQWESRGWWSLEPGTCVQLVNEELSKREKYYLYAGLINPETEMPLVDAKETFCISEVKFSIFGRHDCQARGYLEAKFSKMNLGKDKLTQIRLQPEDFGNPDHD